MHSMKNRAKPALALTLVIAGGVVAPLRSDAAAGFFDLGFEDAGFAAEKSRNVA
jgi:hypothetical protein